MKSYTIRKITGTPDWNAIPVLDIDSLLWTDFVDVRAWAQICWDEDALYLRMEATEPHIRMEVTDPLAEVCDDSCMEFFLQPTQAVEYLNFEMNPLCTYWIGHGYEEDTRIRIMVPDFAERFAPQVTFTDTGWVLNYRIPFAFIRLFFPAFEAQEGLQMRGNCFKCGDKTAKEHYLAWNPVELETPAFHMPQFFGTFILGGMA